MTWRPSEQKSTHPLAGPLAAPGCLWANLGDWRQARDYGAACEALARRVGEAAALTPGCRVFDLACGLGASVGFWRTAFAAALVDAADPDAEAMMDLRRRAPAGLGQAFTADCALLAAPSSPLTADADHSYDALVCVDAAYHFADPAHLWQLASRLLRPGGRVAWTTLAWRAGAAPASLDLGSKLLLKAARVPARALLTRAATATAVVGHGLELKVFQNLNQDVLGGYSTHVQRLASAWGSSAWLKPGWPKVYGAALLARRLLGAGELDYVLFAAQRR